MVTDHTHIVVVNDDPDFLEVMADLLHDHRYAATVIDGDRDNAVELVRAAEPAWVVRITAIVRRDPHLSELPTVICSGDLEGLASLDDKLDGFRRLATIRKPFAIAEMLSTLEHVLEREPA